MLSRVNQLPGNNRFSKRIVAGPPKFRTTLSNCVPASFRPYSGLPLGSESAIVNNLHPSNIFCSRFDPFWEQRIDRWAQRLLAMALIGLVSIR